MEKVGGPLGLANQLFLLSEWVAGSLRDLVSKIGQRVLKEDS